MIKLTVKQLVEASTSGALRRYLSIKKPIELAWKNRKQIATCDEELVLYTEKQKALAQEFGTPDKDNPNMFKFDVDANLAPGEIGPQGKAFNEAFQALLAQTIDTIPGEPVPVSLVKNELVSEADLYLLEPFLTD